MPLSEFLRLAIEKLESSKKQKSCSNDLSSRTESNLVELVWENGHTHHSLSPNTARVHDETLGNSTAARVENLGGVESIFNDISPVVPSGQLELSQNDKMVPWLGYSVDNGVEDYRSERLPEISGVTAKGSSCDQGTSNLDNGQDAFKFSCEARSVFSRPPQQGQTSDPSLLSGVSSNITNNTSDSSSMKMENNSNLLNFSRFSRPATLVKANLPISGGISSSVSSGVKRIEVKEKGPASISNNPVKSMLIERLNSTQTDMDFYIPSAPTVVNSRELLVKEPKESFPAERTEKALTQRTRVVDGDRTVEPMVASSSVGSGNSADRVCYEQTHNLKRNFCDIESECHSDDIQTEPVGVEKPTSARGGTGSKRSRSAHVHNLSERRRRDRINEKMRALQELIPNCNKADKASMLDEAIQYLKNLQHQVQLMSMGAGFCIPPMMLSPGSQHMYPAPIPHFSPMGVGMGMSMSFGNINGGSPQRPIFPVPSIQGAHFPSSALGLTNLHGPNLSIHGHLRPGLHSTVPRTPSIPITGCHCALRISSHNQVPSASSNLNSEDPMTNKNSRNVHNAEARSSINHASDQLQATNEVPKKSSVVQENNRAADAITSARATEISKETGSD